jgi:hypothetical protein
MGTWNSWSDTGKRLFEPLGGDVNNDDAPWWDIGGNMQKDPGAKAEAARKNLLYQQAARAGGFADQAQRGVNQYGQQGQQALAGLQAQANGQNSVSAIQLQQGLQQNLGAQRSLAAGAAPQNQAAAARTAAIQSSRLGSGLAGQQAVAGQQERNAANQQYGQLLGTLRGQDEAAAASARQGALTGYGAGNSGAAEKNNVDKYSGAIIGGLGAIFSDRRLKTEIKDGTSTARSALKGLGAHSFKYKDEDKHGKGERVGIMAQDLEKAGLKHAVIDTPSGKMVHGGHLAAALAAMMPGLDKRIGKLEGKR